MIDGTLLPLAFAPMVNGEDYYTRKGDYAIKGLVVCDDAARITWVEMGWPGSSHHFLEATQMNDVPTLRIIACLQGFILS